ncbi:MAG: hypothetical protein WEC39_02405 [Patescibacteria group bacterium]
MIWAPVLHIYQPPTQLAEILKRITEESYIPLVEFLTRNSQAKLTLNIPGALTKQLSEQGFNDVLSELRRLTERGQVELTGTGAYHPLLSRLPFSEISRQVSLNEEINRDLIGQIFKPRGFFPPELAYSSKVGDAVAELGYDWILVEGAASPTQPLTYDRVYELAHQNLLVFYRQRELSLGIAFGGLKTAADFQAAAQKFLKNGDFILTAMDGETFGHHRKNSFPFLADLYSSFESLTLSEVAERYHQREKTEPMESTWGANHEEVKKGLIYPRWDHAQSPLHPKQWELYNLAITVVNGYVYQVPPKLMDGVPKGKVSPEQAVWVKARQILDRALHSDQFWWASHNPIWHPKMVKRGTKMLRDAILATPEISKLEAQRAKELYEEITTGGLKLYGEKPIIS